MNEIVLVRWIPSTGDGSTVDREGKRSWRPANLQTLNLTFLFYSFHAREDDLSLFSFSMECSISLHHGSTATSGFDSFASSGHASKPPAAILRRPVILLLHL